MEKKTLKFELDSKDIQIKKLLNGDFLRLEAYVVSDAYPNRNGSHFTLESMQDALNSFYDKPVLAYFNNKLGEEGDFMGHECPAGLQYDAAMDNLYYDYTAEHSEVPIGTVRQSDLVEIVERDGLHWIKVNCVLWTKYNYKAVRSLLRTKKGRTKLSVEVEFLDSYIQDGIEIVKKFVADGFALLGRDYNNNEILEGIEGAHATAIDFLDESYSRKQQCLNFAYSAFDNYNKNKVESPGKQASKINNRTFDEEVPLENEKEKEITMEENSDKDDNPKNNNKEGGNAMPEEKEKQEESCITQQESCVMQEEPCETCAQEEQPCEGKECEACEDKQEESCEPEKEEESCEDKQEESCTTEQFEGPEEGHKGEGHEGHKCIQCTIHDLMIDEHEAIEGYRHAISHFAEEFPDVVKVFESIMHEELEHLGELEQCLAVLDPENEEEIAEGKVEAMETIIEANQEAQSEESQPEELHPEEFQEFSDDEDDKEDDSDDDDDKEDSDDDDKEDSDDEDSDDEDSDDEKSDEESDEEFKANPNEDPAEAGAVDYAAQNEDEVIDLNSEPEINVDGKSMETLITEATVSIHAPEVQTSAEEVGAANAQASAVMDGAVQSEIVGEETVKVKGDIEGPAQEPDKVEQPDDKERELDDIKTTNYEAENEVFEAENAEEEKAEVEQTEVEQFSGENAENANPEVVSEDMQVSFEATQASPEATQVSPEANPEMQALLEKYAELEAKFNALNEANLAAEEARKVEEAAQRDREAERLAQFGANFINEDRVVDKESKKEYAAQVEEKCKAFELSSEEEVVKFAKSLMAMYYYENSVESKKNARSELSIAIDRLNGRNNQASYSIEDNKNNKLKDAINKLNYLKEE